MADKDSKKGIDDGPAGGPSGVQSTTTSLPAASPGSKEIGPSPPDTEHEAPPLHTARPDVPIAQTLVAGAGEHTPPDPKLYDSEGRPRSVTGVTVTVEENAK